MKDQVNAFVEIVENVDKTSLSGPLAGCSLAVKDIFDVAGFKTGCGSPEKMAEATPAIVTAPSVQKLINAGAAVVGKTVTEELAFSLNGDNVHFPKPINVAAPGRLTGGSSSGSAAAVTAGLVDLATGSDTGGSVRAPASYCGLVGLRATHGRLSLENTMPLAESFDVFGWFARDGDLYSKVANIMFDDGEHTYKPKRILFAEDCLTLLMGIDEARALDPAMEHVAKFADVTDVSVSDGDMEDWYWIFRKMQGFEAWESHGEWIDRINPNLGPGVKERFEYSKTITKEMYDACSAKRAAITRHMEELIGDDGLLVLPTVPSIAPKADMDFDWLDAFRNRALKLLCISGLTGLPQLTLPMAKMNGCPLGLSLMGPRGTDRQLVEFGVNILKTFKA